MKYDAANLRLTYFAVILCFLAYVHAVTDTVDLLTGGRCGANSRVAGGVVHSHQPFDSPPPITNNITCFFTMQAALFREKIRFVFQFFELVPTDCSISNLEIYNGARDSDPLLTRLCPGDSVSGREFLSTSFYLTLKLNVAVDGSTTPQANFSGFWVSFTDDRTPCADPSLELRCNTMNRCIYQELECDGLDSCGDGTDEPASCDSATGSSSDSGPDLTILYVVLSLAFSLFAVYLVYAFLSVACFKTYMLGCLHRCCFWLMRKRRRRQNGKKQGKIEPQPDEKEDVKADELALEDLDNLES